ncbi:hypothetical protein glysoja_000298 [Glycine soja]|nr:hypothetical protein JHK86_003366 [Glycine max]KHN00630.1 hypothetical protein glysoja_000298 [Glycine soja]
MRLISTFFDHTETASNLCLHFHHCLLRALDLHAPLLDFFQTLNPTNPTQNDCVRAVRLFHALQNPIPDSTPSPSPAPTPPTSKRSSIAASRNCCPTVVVTVYAVAALAAAAGAVSVCAFEKKELAALRQLDVAAKCAYVLSNDLPMIRCW